MEKELPMKKCTKCGVEKEHTLEFFHKYSRSRVGLTATCKECRNKKAKEINALTENKKANKEKYKTKYDDPVKRAERNKKTQELRSTPEGKEKRRAESKKYKSTKRYKENRNKRLQERRKTDLEFRTKTLLRKLVKRSLDKVTKTKPSTSTLTKYTPAELIKHLNSGRYTLEDYNTNKKGDIKFHIDHIIPIDYFLPKITTNEVGGLTVEGIMWAQKCNSLRNLRVWPKYENESKGSKLNMELIKEHGIEDLL